MIKSEFLENFCSPKSYNGIFNEPFINGKYVVATDRHSLIVVDKEEVERDDPLKESEKDVPAIEPYDETKSQLRQLKNKALEAQRMLDERNAEQELGGEQ